MAGEVYQDESNLQMSETPGESKGRPDDKYSDDDDSDDDSQNGGRQATTTSHSFMRDGLLIRRSLPSSNTQPDVELDNLVAREVNEWRSEATGQVLRQRRNVWEHAMDEVRYTQSSSEYTQIDLLHIPSPSRRFHLHRCLLHVFMSSLTLPRPRLLLPLRTVDCLLLLLNKNRNRMITLLEVTLIHFLNLRKRSPLHCQPMCLRNL